MQEETLNSRSILTSADGVAWQRRRSRCPSLAAFRGAGDARRSHSHCPIGPVSVWGTASSHCVLTWASLGLMCIGLWNANASICR